MKIALLLLPLLILSSCSLDITGGGQEKIVELERKVQEEQEKNIKLQAENAELSDQVRKLKAGLWNKEFWEVTPLEGGFSGPEDMTYKEVSNEACIKKAQDEYVALGNQQCQQMGYTGEDIKNKKCKLTREFIQVIQKKLEDAVIACGPGQ